MLYVIRRNWQEWVEAFSTLAEAQARFDMLKAEQPEWNLQIVCEEQQVKVERGVCFAFTVAGEVNSLKRLLRPVSLR